MLVFVAVCSVLFGTWKWLFEWPRVAIAGADIQGQKSVTIETPDAYYLSVRIYGSLDGNATITDPWGNRTSIGPGSFDFSQRGDFYDQRATFQYASRDAKSGRVTIRYSVGN